MAAQHHPSVKGVTFLPDSDPSLDGRGLRILVVHTRWNLSIVSSLVAATRETLARHGVAESDIVVRQVPGSFELPNAVDRLLREAADSRPFDAAVAVGVLIKGDTMHFEYIADATTHGLMRVSLENPRRTPVVFGVLTCNTEQQALARAGLVEGGHNHGIDWGKAAIEMARLSRA
ncbi:Lumazine synthase [Zopfochytrium polystomum]|nr:Lumazine synthase [Zopfochytrium polystomum]